MTERADSAGRGHDPGHHRPPVNVAAEPAGGVGIGVACGVDIADGALVEALVEAVGGAVNGAAESFSGAGVSDRPIDAREATVRQPSSAFLSPLTVLIPKAQTELLPGYSCTVREKPWSPGTPRTELTSGRRSSAR